MANIGAYIKSIVDKIKIDNMEEFCLTHLNMHKQSFYKNLKKTSLNSDLILRYSEVFDKDFFAHFYEEEPLKKFRQIEIDKWNTKIDSLNKEIATKDILLEKNEELLSLQRKYIAEIEKKIAKMEEENLSKS